MSTEDQNNVDLENDQNSIGSMSDKSSIADIEAEKKWEEAEKELKKKKESPSKEEKKDEAQEQTQSGKKEKPTTKRHILHKFGFALTILATLSAFCMGLSQIIGIIFSDVGITQIVLRLYVILFCGVVILVEMEWTKFARESHILHNWWTRGLIYTFLGVIGLEEIETQTFDRLEFRGFNPAELYVKVIAWVMLVVGCFYFLLGVLCIQKRYEHQREDFEERKARALIEAEGGDAAEEP